MRSGLALLAMSVLLCVIPRVPQAQTALSGENVSALAPENLAKKRPKPPFDLTGDWNMVIDPKTGMHLFEPHPKLTPVAQAELDKLNSEAAKGFEYRDDPGACWPLGMPRMMTRFWPIQIIQLPTMIEIVTMFNNSVRWIYMDGRSQPPEDEQVLTYGGHSVGHWEGNTLVVETVGMTDDHHWIQEGIPASKQLRIIERYRMVDGGNAFDVEFSMTDPVNWEGTWVNTKRFFREKKTDIEEHVCVYEQMSQLPSFKFNLRK